MHEYERSNSNAAGYSAGAFYLAALTAGHLARPCVGMASSVSSRVSGDCRLDGPHDGAL
jgi:hypothetical protein